MENSPVFVKTEEFEQFKSLWKQIVPVVQNLHDTLLKYEIKPNLELIDDLLNGGTKAREIYLANVQKQVDKLVTNSVLRDSLLKLDHTKVFNELNVFVQQYQKIITGSFYAVPIECLKVTLSDLKKGIVSISTKTIDSIKDEFFTIYLKTEDQKKAFELASSITENLQELIALFQKRNPKGFIPPSLMVTPEIKFSDLFDEAEGEVEFNLRTLELL